MPVLLEESTTDVTSPVLERMITGLSYKNKAPDSIQKDYLLILLLVAMIENGFSLVDDDYEIIEYTSVSSEILRRWKSQTGVYEVRLISHNLKNNPVKLIMCPLGAMALVNVVIKEFEDDIYSVCLPISKYVVSPQAATIPKIFRDLRHFCMIFKSKVLHAVKSKILDLNGFISPSILGLPEELLFKILLNISLKDVINLSKVCVRFRDVLQSQNFWYDMCKRDFETAKDLSIYDENDWREFYKACYIGLREKQFSINNSRAQTIFSSLCFIASNMLFNNL